MSLCGKINKLNEASMKDILKKSDKEFAGRIVSIINKMQKDNKSDKDIFKELKDAAPKDIIQMVLDGKGEDDVKKKLGISEAVDVSGIIKAVIDTNWSKDNESQMKVLQLMKGIATSDEEVSNKFMAAIDKFTSSLKPEDFK